MAGTGIRIDCGKNNVPRHRARTADGDTRFPDSESERGGSGNSVDRVSSNTNPAPFFYEFISLPIRCDQHPSQTLFQTDDADRLNQNPVVCVRINLTFEICFFLIFSRVSIGTDILVDLASYPAGSMTVRHLDRDTFGQMNGIRLIATVDRFTQHRLILGQGFTIGLKLISQTSQEFVIVFAILSERACLI